MCKIKCYKFIKLKFYIDAYRPVKSFRMEQVQLFEDFEVVTG